ncbi:hypothetical protein UVI_02062940 [Ustilaginoidea virens]|uniref:Uncharacterized protein n=1 Tax=Ustilaginoidea virens TaxID=1159556 RepID=A0A1B5LA86_USTVR|nr:hypothetical protein UVI_02062940 [Ustilaginoidea virens]
MELLQRKESGNLFRQGKAGDTARARHLSATEFSLQQLLFDLDSSIVQRVPEIKGVEPGRPDYEALIAASKEDSIASTLDNVCVVNNHRKYVFDYYWVVKSQVGQIHGVLSMKKATLFKVFENQLLE